MYRIFSHACRSCQQQRLVVVCKEWHNQSLNSFPQPPRSSVRRASSAEKTAHSVDSSGSSGGDQQPADTKAHHVGWREDAEHRVSVEFVVTSRKIRAYSSSTGETFAPDEYERTDSSYDPVSAAIQVSAYGVSDTNDLSALYCRRTFISPR